MSKKLTYEFVKSKFEEKGYDLLSTEYINNRIKLDYICSKGHVNSTSYVNLSRDKHCHMCAPNNKLTYEFVKSKFEEAGYDLLSEVYINAHAKLEYTCPEEHNHSVSFDSFSRGSRCPTCFTLSITGTFHHNYKGGVIKKKLPLYETYAHKLNLYQPVYKIIQDGLELLGVECKYCDKVFVPKLSNVVNRVSTISGNIRGEHNLYCSEGCKIACPIYGQILWPKYDKPYENTRANKKQWATMVKERDNHTCQICGQRAEVMYAHHIDPVANNPTESMDIDNGITLCKECHNQVHKIPGCGYNQLKCNTKHIGETI